MFWMYLHSKLGLELKFLITIFPGEVISIIYSVDFIRNIFPKVSLITVWGSVIFFISIFTCINKHSGLFFASLCRHYYYVQEKLYGKFYKKFYEKQERSEVTRQTKKGSLLCVMIYG